MEQSRQEGEKLQSAADALLRAALAQPGVQQLVDVYERYQDTEDCMRLQLPAHHLEGTTASSGSAVPFEWQ
ncbi:MAG: hypothetical protein WCP21_07595 [Armatimonadota bacterium]